MGIVRKIEKVIVLCAMFISKVCNEICYKIDMISYKIEKMLLITYYLLTYLLICCAVCSRKILMCILHDDNKMYCP